jgi:hypothetical protein
MFWKKKPVKTPDPTALELVKAVIAENPFILATGQELDLVECCSVLLPTEEALRKLGIKAVAFRKPTEQDHYFLAMDGKIMACPREDIYQEYCNGMRLILEKR